MFGSVAFFSLGGGSELWRNTDGWLESAVMAISLSLGPDSRVCHGNAGSLMD